MFIVLLYVRDENHKVIQMFEDIPLSQVSIFNLTSTGGIFLADTVLRIPAVSSQDLNTSYRQGMLEHQFCFRQILLLTTQ